MANRKPEADSVTDTGLVTETLSEIRKAKMAKRWIIYLAVFGAVLYFFGSAGVDPDLWGHLKFGREIRRSGEIPGTDPYSYTAGNRPWFNHEWLAELTMAAAYGLGGTGGLVVLRLSFGFFLALLMTGTVRRFPEDGIVFLAFFWLAAPLIAQGFALRPQIFSYLLAGCYFWLFTRASEGRRLALILCLPLIVFWVNLHGGFLMGLFMLLIFSVWNTVSPRRRRPFRVWFPWAVFVAAFLSTLLNPYGLHLWVFLAGSLSKHRLELGEWRPFVPGAVFFERFALLSAVTLSIALFRRGARRSVGFWLFVGLTLAAYFQRRHSPFAALAALAWGPSALAAWARDLAARKGWRLSDSAGKTVWIGVGGIGILQTIMGVSLLMPQPFKIMVEPTHYPVRAVEFMKENRIGGNLLTMFEWGEYCIYHLYPSCRVAFDGRFRTVYPGRVIKAYWDFDWGGADGLVLLEDYPTTLALLEKAMWGYRYLDGSPDWLKVYEDERSALFVRDLPENRALVEKLKRRGAATPERRTENTFP